MDVLPCPYDKQGNEKVKQAEGAEEWMFCRVLVTETWTIQTVLLTMVIISRVLLALISFPLWCQSNAKLKRVGKSFSFSAEDFDDPRYKGVEIFDSGPIRRNSDDRHDGTVFDQFDEDHSQSSKSGKSNACVVKTIPDGCKLVSDCDVHCSISMFGHKGQMEVAFPCKKSLQLVVNIAVSLFKKRNVYSLAVNYVNGTVIKNLGHSIGNYKSQILFSATMKTLADGKVIFELYSTIKGDIQGSWSNMVKTKFIEVSRNALTDKCESKGKKQVSVEGPCAKLKLPSICAITPDCMHIYCELKFAGQKVSFSFSINVCENPMTLSVGADIPTLHIHWEKKFKSKMRIPIPGYGFNAPGISGGVQIRVLLKPKRGRLQLKIKLLVGAKLGWAEIFPLKLTLVSLRLPIKIAGCGKTSLLDRSKKRITSSTPTTVVSHKRPTTSFTPTTVSHNLSRKKKQSNPTSSPSTIASTSRKLPRPTEDEDYDISFEE